MKEGWEEQLLGNLCQIELGRTPYRGDKKLWDTEKETKNVWLSIADMLKTDGVLVSDSKEYISNDAAKTSKIVKKGTLLLSFKLTLGRLAFAGRDLYTNEAIAALTIKNNHVIDKYFLYRFLSFFDWHAASEGDLKVKGKTLNKAKLKEIEVRFPKSLSEQQRIVSIIDQAFEAIDKAIENTQKNLQNAKELFESYLSNVFEKGGEDWEIKTLGEVCNFQNGFAFQSKTYKKDGLPIIRITNIQNNKIDTTDIVYFDDKDYDVNLDKFKVHQGDLLIAMSGATTGKLGISSVEAVFYLNQRVGKFIPGQSLNKTFLFYYLSTKVEESLKISAGSAQPNLSTKQINDFIIPIPPLSEQQRIVSQLDVLKNKTQKLEDFFQHKLLDLEELKKSVLNKAFAGEL